MLNVFLNYVSYVMKEQLLSFSHFLKYLPIHQTEHCEASLREELTEFRNRCYNLGDLIETSLRINHV